MTKLRQRPNRHDLRPGCRGCRYFRDKSGRLEPLDRKGQLRGGPICRPLGDAGASCLHWRELGGRRHIIIYVQDHHGLLNIINYYY